MTEQQDEKPRHSRSWVARNLPELGICLSSPPFLLTAIVAACGVITLSALLFNDSGNIFLIIVFFSSWFSLAVLLPILAVLTHGFKTYVAAFFVLLLDGIVLPGALIPLFVAIPILITLVCVTFFYGTFTKSELRNQSLVEGLQFQIKHIFIATAVIASAVAMLQTFASSGGRVSIFPPMEILIVIVLLNINALVSVWAILGEQVGRRLGVSLFSACALLAVGLFFLNYWVPFSGKNAFIFPATVATEIMLVWTTSTLQLYLFRRQGYRFVRHSK